MRTSTVVLAGLLALASCSLTRTTPAAPAEAADAAAQAPAPVTVRHPASSSSGTRPQRPAGSHRPTKPTPLVLLPSACTQRDLILRPGPFLEPMTAMQGIDLHLRNTASRPCWVGGVPRVSFADAHHQPMPFHASAQRPVRPSHVVLAPHRDAQVVIVNPRCDIGQGRTAASVSLRVPGLVGSFLLRSLAASDDGIPLCRGEDAATTREYRQLRVSPFVPAALLVGPYATPTVPDHVALRLDDSSRPLGSHDHALRYARADVDGDGHRDVVIQGRGQRLVARLSRLGRQVSTPAPDVAGTLRGLTPLLGGAADVLLASRSVGSQVAFTDTVLRLGHGRLRAVRLRSGRPLRLHFAQGHGDGYAGVT